MAGLLQRVRACRWIRAMRGGTRPQLLETNDGHHYIVKFGCNLQGPRTLINEVIGTFLLTRLHIATPPVALITVDQDLVDSCAEFVPTGQRSAMCAGEHFGSQHPGTPGRHPVYDCFPDKLLHNLYNGADLCAALVFDKWVSNADGRQAIFFRADVASGGGLSQVRWVTQIIDNGLAFQGNDWTFRDSAIQGIYARTAVYGRHVSMLTFEPWLDRLMELPTEIADEALSILPPSWTSGEERYVDQLLRRLVARRSIVPDLVRESVSWLRGQRRDRTRSILPSAVLSN